MTTPDEPTRTRPFADFLAEHNRGRSLNELGETLQLLVARVRETGKKGSITYTLTVEPMKDGNDALIAKDEIKTRIPEHTRPGSIFWADDDNNLVGSDPNQLAFDSLREVPPPAPPKSIDTIDPDTGEVTTA